MIISTHSDRARQRRTPCSQPQPAAATSSSGGGGHLAASPPPPPLPRTCTAVSGDSAATTAPVTAVATATRLIVSWNCRDG